MPSTHKLSLQNRRYEQELHKLRVKLRAFASEQPETARQLDLNEGYPSDPDISRLLEGVAWLCTDLQIRLDDGYESVCRQIYQLFYSDFLKPVPALGILTFATGTLKEATTLEQGSFFELTDKQGKYQFQTCRNQYLIPANINGIESLSAPFPEEVMALLPEVRSALKISIASNDLSTGLGEYLGQGIEFYANPNALRADEFLDTLVSSLKRILICFDQQVIAIPVERLSWPMFGGDCRILPTDPGLSDSHLLLMNFFQAPELFRFLHLDLTGYAEKIRSTTLDILWLLDDEIEHSTDNIGLDHLLLGCTPVVNLFEGYTNPVKINHETHDTPLSMGPLHHHARIREILSVTDITEPEQPVELSALFHSSFAQVRSDVSWQFSSDQDTDYLQFIDTGQHNHPDRRLLAVKCLCYDPQASQLPVTAKVRGINVSLPCAIRLLNDTSGVYVDGLLSAGASWDLLSALQLNIRSFRIHRNEASKLQHLLELFIQPGSGNSGQIVRSIESLEVSHDLRPTIIDNRHFVSQGCCFHITLNRQELTAFPATLLLNLLCHVLNFWRPMGTHSRMIAHVKSGSDAGIKTLNFPVLTDD
ncbi:type VI secretion system baseplate subunit TssF [Endozoicomonas sp. GU-1]|uniref:type VI secretion system baseplate subunit TssF n=1 Tax=Endozoicomonas sp. GU-1 TaxID=3009078 RepID=UPI0022B4183B|nr:type VI secretion system baseplate subunit TssF [Endozoicomonas sp. GU-1]WBA83407.1 type VI secretion system baseplate subunit TssF [Endozoicomonas sp. GU-1]